MLKIWKGELYNFYRPMAFGALWTDFKSMFYTGFKGPCHTILEFGLN